MQLDAFPKHELRLHAHVLQADGGELAAMIVAASLALADAGVPLNDLVPACTVAQPPLPLRSAPSSSPPPRAAASSSAAARQPSVLDPCASELRAAAGVLTLALAPSTREATQWRQSDCFDEERRRSRRGVTRAWQPWVPAWSSQQNVRARYSRRAQHIHDSTLIMLDEIDIVWKPGRQRCGKTANRTSQDAAPVPRGPRPRQPHTQRLLG